VLTGVPNPDRQGHWIVPPWAADTSFAELTAHFLRFHPWGNENTTHLHAYYQGYVTALDAAEPPDEHAHPAYLRWRNDLRSSIGRCAELYEEKMLKSTTTCPVPVLGK
jgi:hypothetical protein